VFVCLFSWRYNPLWLYFHSPVAGFSLLVFSRFLDHTQRRATVGRTPLGEWSIRRRDLYLTTHNTLNRQTSMSPVGFEPRISAGERPKTYALDGAATGTVISYEVWPTCLDMIQVTSMLQSFGRMCVCYTEKSFQIVASYRLLGKCREQPLQYTYTATAASHLRFMEVCILLLWIRSKMCV
jgi:hypothetical protein